MTPRRILLSARDPRPARLIIQLARNLKSDDRFQVELVGQGAALDLMKAAGLQPHVVDLPALDQSDDPERMELFESVGRLLGELDPHAVITGLSGPGLGVDEALIHLCQDRPAFSLQDYAGWVVPGFGRPAPTYFVADQRSARLTCRLLGVEPVVVGDLCSAEFAELDIPALRAQGRLMVEPRELVVTFYGQPCWRYEGYRETLTSLAHAARSRPELQFLYRPHPKETDAERNSVHALFDAEGVVLARCPATSIEMSLAMTDVVLSVFSTVVQDHVALQRCSPVPIGTAAYLLFDPAIRARLVADSGSDQPLALVDGFADSAESVEDLVDLLHRSTAPSAAAASWRKVQQSVPTAGVAPRFIADYVLARLTFPPAVG